MQEQFNEALALAKELLKPGSDPHDERWQIVNQLAERESLRRSQFRFIERYFSGELKFHAHGALIFARGALVLKTDMGDRIEFCAVIEKLLDDGGRVPLSIDHGLLAVNTDDRRIETAVLVDVREFCKHPEHAMVRTPSIVRLQTFNQCECAIGNPREIWTEHILGNRGQPFELFRDIGQQGELALSRQDGGELSSGTIPLDKIEEQVIQGRPALIEQFASEDRNINRWLFGDAQCYLAIRLAAGFVRVSATVFGNAILDDLTVYHYPNDFGASGLESITHRDGPRVA